MKNITDAEPDTPFGKFKQLTERLLAVPKKELDQKIAEYERDKKRKKKKKPAK